MASAHRFIHVREGAHHAHVFGGSTGSQGDEGGRIVYRADADSVEGLLSVATIESSVQGTCNGNDMSYSCFQELQYYFVNDRTQFDRFTIWCTS
jgi:hypothetical protein